MSSLTPFAGLEVLEPTDSFATNDWRFQSINPKIVDRLLQIGAVTHKHDAHAALANPTGAPVVTQSATGGTIPANTLLGVCATYIDARGGETAASPVASLTTPAGLLAPQNAPTLTTDHVSGALLSGNYTYAVTVTDGAGGETTIGPSASIFVEPGFPKDRVIVKGLKAILEEVAGVKAGAEWRLWRSLEGGAWYLMAHGTTDEVKEEGTVAGDCTVEPPSRSTVSGTNRLKITVSSAVGAEKFRVYIGVNGEFNGASYLGEYPSSEFGKEIVVTGLSFLTGLPPLVTESYPGANKLDPDTELLAFRWKKAVTKQSELPVSGNEDGDVREVLETHTLWVYNNSTKEWQSASGEKAVSHGYAYVGIVPINVLPGMYVHKATANRVRLLGVIGDIGVGTQVKINVRRNGAVIAAYKEVAITKVASELFSTLELADKDKIDIQVVSNEGGAENLSFTIVVGYT